MKTFLGKNLVRKSHYSIIMLFSASINFSFFTSLFCCCLHISFSFVFVFAFSVLLNPHSQIIRSKLRRRIFF